MKSRAQCSGSDAQEQIREILEFAAGDLPTPVKAGSRTAAPAGDYLPNSRCHQLRRGGKSK
jgi:hypothetical protein